MRRLNLFGFGSRGGPMRTGWNSTAAAMVVTSANAINLPMLDVPGWLESHRLPNAVAVVMALKDERRNLAPSAVIKSGKIRRFLARFRSFARIDSQLRGQ